MSNLEYALAWFAAVAALIGWGFYFICAAINREHAAEARFYRRLSKEMEAELTAADAQAGQLRQELAERDRLLEEARQLTETHIDELVRSIIRGGA